MPGAARLGDKAQVQADAHGCPACPHPGTGPIVVASTNVFVNSKGSARKKDLGIHAVCCGPNLYNIKEGSPTVYVNGQPMARMQDGTKHCGGDGNITEGSPDVLIDDGASGAGLGSYVINALKILLEQTAATQAAQAKKISDTHTGGAPAKAAGRDLAKDEKPAKKSGSITAARWAVQRAANGQEVELHIETQEGKGELTIEIWSQSADRAQDKKVKSESASAGKKVKKKIKLEIPPDAAAGNECFFYFVVKDEQGGEQRSDPLFVDRAPFKFSV
jgi:uncharacterized Zn-binding protein involved in type VI secretion